MSTQQNTGIEKPKISDLRQALDKIISGNIMTRLQGLAETMQWYDKGLFYCIDRGHVDKAMVDPQGKRFNKDGLGRMNKLRAVGAASHNQGSPKDYLKEKETFLAKAIRVYQGIVDHLNPIVDSKTGRRQADVDDYYDKYNAQAVQLEEEEKRQAAKYKPVLDFLNTVFGNLGFTISIDPNATQYKWFSGPETMEIVYSAKAARDIYDTLRHEGLLVAMRKELMHFSRAKAMAKDSNDQWEIRYDVQIKTIETMLDEFINFARMDVGRWKLLRYGAAPVQQPSVQGAAATPTTKQPSAPKPPKVKSSVKPGESHIGDYKAGTPLHTLFNRMKDGKIHDKAALYKDLGGVPHNTLAWLTIHGTKSGKWKIVKHPGDKLQMIVN